MTDLRFVSTEQPKMAAFNERFGKLNELYEYWWQRTATTVKYRKTLTDAQYYPGFSPDTATFLEADEVAVDEYTGELTLVDPTTYTTRPTPVVGKYYQSPDGGIRECNIDPAMPATTDIITFSSVVTWGDSGGYTIYQMSYASVVATETYRGDLETTNVHSPDRGAYPDSGTDDDGNEWKFLGVPFDNAVDGLKVEAGNYIGTGNFGKGSENTLTFGFVPRIVFIVPRDNYSQVHRAVLIHGCTAAPSSDYLTCGISSVVWDDDSRSVTWYAAAQGGSGTNRQEIAAQLNSGGVTYLYLAIG